MTSEFVGASLLRSTRFPRSRQSGRDRSPTGGGTQTVPNPKSQMMMSLETCAGGVLGTAARVDLKELQ